MELSARAGHVYGPVPPPTTEGTQRKNLFLPLVPHAEVTPQEKSSLVFFPLAVICDFSRGHLEDGGGQLFSTLQLPPHT